MANLLSASIGANYKGMLNLGATINTPLSTTLQAITDGDGNTSPLQLATDRGSLVAPTLTGSSATSALSITQTLNTTGSPDIFLMDIAHTASGASTNLANWKYGGTSKFSISKAGDLNLPSGRINMGIGGGIFFYGAGIKFSTSNGTMEYSNTLAGLLSSHIFSSSAGNTVASGIQKVVDINSNFGSTASSSCDFNPLRVTYIINNTSVNSGTATGISLNATETNLNGMAHRIANFQVNGVSKFSIENNGAVQSLYHRFGSGSPEGVVTAPVGCHYVNTTGSLTTLEYLKTTGTGNTGWTAIH